MKRGILLFIFVISLICLVSADSVAFTGFDTFNPNDGITTFSETQQPSSQQNTTSENTNIQGTISLLIAIAVIIAAIIVFIALNKKKKRR